MNYRELAKKGGEAWRTSVEDRFEAIYGADMAGSPPPPAPVTHTKLTPGGTFGGFDVPEGDKFIIADVPSMPRVVRAINSERGRVNEILALNLGRRATPILSDEYGSWIGDAGVLRYFNAHFRVEGGTDPYGSRAVADEIYGDDSSWENDGHKALIRWTRTVKGRLANLTLRGGPIWLGGGAGDGAVDQLGFVNVPMSNIQHEFVAVKKPDGSLEHMDAWQWYSKCHHLDMTNVRLTLPEGVRVGTVWDGAHDLTWRNWSIRRMDATGRPVYTRPLEWSDFKDGAQLQAQGAARGLRIAA